MRLKFVLAFVLVICFALFAAAQEERQNSVSEQNRPAETRLFDEFGLTSHCDLGARIQNVFIELGDNPGTRAYIIIYRGANALPVAQTERTVQIQIKRIKEQVTFMNLDDSRIEIVDGGFRDNNTILNEVWIIPEGGAIPKPSATVEKSKLPVDKAFKVDERGLYVYEAQRNLPEIDPVEETEIPGEENPEPAPESSVETETVENSEMIENSEAETEEYSDEYNPYDWISDYFAEQLRGDKKLKGVVIFYADETEYDISKLRANIDEGIRKSSEKSAFDLNGVKVIFGGYRKDSKIEFWIVPPGAKEPLPTLEEKIESEL